MSGLRCWPGALAYITDYMWQGRMVEVIERHRNIGPDESVEPGAYWRVRAIGWDVRDGGWHPPIPGVFAFPDHLLRPILPRPGTETETVEEVLEAARSEPAEA